MRAETAISERQACRLVGIYRSTLRYEAQQTVETQALSAGIVELAQEHQQLAQVVALPMDYLLTNGQKALILAIPGSGNTGDFLVVTAFPRARG